MKLTDQGLVFSTGKIISRQLGLIEDNIQDFLLTYGYDGKITISDFTEIEKIELADYMISLWEKFKDEARKG